MVEVKHGVALRGLVARNVAPILASIFFAAPLLGQTTAFPAKDGQIPVPNCLDMISHQQDYAACTPSDLSEWRKDISNWRDETRIRIRYNDAQYSRPELQWTQSSFMQPQLMVEDRFFYDPVAGRYTVDRYLDDMQRRMGGIDSVLIWHNYPNIGIDNRNEFDLLRAMPGGIPALKAMVNDFHKRGVRVLFPMMPWDQGTREEGRPDWETIATLMAEIGVDGVNGDTMAGIHEPIVRPPTILATRSPSSLNLLRVPTRCWPTTT
jgi:gamma-glutamyl hercynylcysteine S-oxide synthase